jgi:hypothetical protein
MHPPGRIILTVLGTGASCYDELHICKVTASWRENKELGTDATALEFLLQTGLSARISLCFLT